MRKMSGRQGRLEMQTLVPGHAVHGAADWNSEATAGETAMPSEQSDTPFCTSEAGLSYSQTCTCAPGCKLATAVALFDPIGTSCSRSTRNFCLCPSRLTSTCSLSMTSCTTPLSRGCNRGSRILRNPSAAPGTGARAAMMRTMGQRLRLRHILAVLSITEYRNRSYSKSPE